MLKNLFILTLIFAFTASCGTAQMQYSTKNKKAIKLFEKAKKEQDEEKLVLLTKALDKDPNFLEAHDLMSQIYADQGLLEKSVFHEKELLRINPHQNFNGTLYLSIAQKQYVLGEYDDAIKYADLVLNYPRPTVTDQVTAQALNVKQQAEFAKNAMENPLDITPINIGPGINTEDNEYFPTITVDGKTILFTRELPLKGMPRGQEDFFVSTLSEEGAWQKAIPMPNNINTSGNEGAPTLAPDGKSLIFVACETMNGTGDYGPNKQGYGSCDLFFTKKIGSRWMNPINLPGKVNTSSWETQPSLSSDGKTMYFIRSTGRGYKRNSDIYVSFKDDNGNWSMPGKLPPNINTPYKEESVLIHPDGKTLYFSSNGHIGMGGNRFVYD